MRIPRTLRVPGLRAGALFLSVLVPACAHTATAGSVSPAPLDFPGLADSIVAAPPLDRSHIGIEVYEPATGRILYRHDSERHFVPASNEKLWATSAALALLGPDFRYRTPVLGVGLDAGSGTAQALVVVGRGDPTFSARFDTVGSEAPAERADTTRPTPEDPVRGYQRDLSVLDSLADSVVASGVTHVVGDLVIDASAFDEEIVPGAWTFGNLNGTSAPPTAAFIVGEGVFRLLVTPGPAVGSPAVVTSLAPAGVVPIVSRVTTTEGGPPDATRGRGRPGRRILQRRGPWDDTLRLGGEIGIGAGPQTLRLPMTDPVRFAAEAFAEKLRDRGVTIDGGVRVVHDSAMAAAVREGRLEETGDALPVREVAAWTSPNLDVIVHNILRPSQNWIAEQLLRTLGAEKGGQGSWRAGLSVETSFLFNTVGIDSAALRLNDGSGMSPQNLVTPHAIVQLLEYARTAPWGPVFKDALATPGQPGTLQRRLIQLEGRLSGKTGTLNGVNALSGYVRTRDGHELIFSILSNASGLGSGPVVSAIDRMVDALANTDPIRP
jgi:D-alanyl-D-alanine carboxypeptidase/D-alanyl-D-alanine-endopeptidase (penicillin-binding protein 4)